MSELTTNDVINIQTVAIIRVAKCLRVSIDNKTFSQIFSDISDTNDPLFNLLDNFVVAYRQYQNHHVLHDEKVNNLEEITSIDDDNLTEFMRARDTSRNLLIEALVDKNF